MRQGFTLGDFAEKHVHPLLTDEGWNTYREDADDNHKFSAVTMTWRFMEHLLTCYKIHDKLRQIGIVLCDGFNPTHDCSCEAIRVRDGYQI